MTQFLHITADQNPKVWNLQWWKMVVSQVPNDTLSSTVVVKTGMIWKNERWTEKNGNAEKVMVPSSIGLEGWLGHPISNPRPLDCNAL
jgi:SRSO17 transposase